MTFAWCLMINRGAKSEAEVRVNDYEPGKRREDEEEGETK